MIPCSTGTHRRGAPAAAMLFITMALLAGLASGQACGDCDCDGDIDIIDSLRAAQISAMILIPTPVQQNKCDVNASTTISILDSLFIAQTAAGIPVTLLCSGTGNSPPTADMCNNSTVMGDIPITYTLSDAEGDICSISVQYSTNGGVTFTATCTEEPVGSQGTTGLTSSVAGVPHVFVWDSLADIGPVNQVGVVVRVTPSDAAQGFSCQTPSFTVANMPVLVPPTATGCMASVALCGGLVTVDYTLIDPDSPTVDIVAEYSTNGGLTWSSSLTQGMGSQGLLGLAASTTGVPHVFVWDSGMDLMPTLHSNVIVRITPMDPAPGTFCTTAPFMIDLRAPPVRPGGTGTYGPPVTGILDVWVIQDPAGTPIPGASVMVGLSQGMPFAGNTGTTDASGHIRFCNAALTGQNIITAGATGRQYMTFYNTTASQVVLALKLVDDFPVITDVTGSMTGVAIPSCSAFGTPLLGAGLALPQVRASDLFSGFLGFVLGPTDCWQSGSTLVGNIALPGNVYIPSQTIPTPFCTTSLSQHPFHLNMPASTSQRLIGLFGRVDALAASGAATVADLVNAFDLREFAISSSFTVSTTSPQTRNIPRTGALTANVTMTVSGAPAGMDVFGVVAGDLSGSNGDGPLGVMGARIATYPALGSGSVPLTLTTVPAAATGGAVGYVTLAAALFIDNPAPPAGQENAISAILKRDGGVSSSGGSVAMNTFFPAPVLTPPVILPGTFSMSNPSIASPNLVDVCLHRLERLINDPTVSIPPCVGANMPTRTSVYWEVMTAGGVTSFTLPTLPVSFPRSAQDGLFDPMATPENDLIQWNAAFIGIGGTGLPAAPPFDFNTFELLDLPLWVTHLAANLRQL